MCGAGERRQRTESGDGLLLRAWLRLRAWRGTTLSQGYRTTNLNRPNNRLLTVPSSNDSVRSFTPPNNPRGFPDAGLGAFSHHRGMGLLAAAAVAVPRMLYAKTFLRGLSAPHNAAETEQEANRE